VDIQFDAAAAANVVPIFGWIMIKNAAGDV
jgi:hypothetical protein